VNETDRRLWPLFEKQEYQAERNGQPCIQGTKVCRETGLNPGIVDKSIARWKARKRIEAANYAQEEIAKTKIPISTSAPPVEPQPRDAHQGEPEAGGEPPGVPEEEIPETTELRIKRLKSERDTLKKKGTLFELIGERLEQTISALPEVKELVFPDVVIKTRQPEEINIMLSDIHCGLKVGQEDSGGLGSYDTTVFEKRLDYFMRSIVSILEIHRSIECPAINIFNIGDMVDGANVYPGHQRQSELHAADQTVYLSNKLAMLYLFIKSLGPWDVNIYSVVGNHGRVGKKGEENPLNNFDYITYEMIRLLCRRNENLHIHNARSWYMPVERRGVRIHVNHGADVRSWMNLPYYGLERCRARTGEMFRQLGADFDLYLFGHFHTPAVLGSIILNGAWPGGTEFSMKSLQLNTSPCQMMFGLHEKHGMTWARSVSLDDVWQQEPIEFVK